MSNCHFAECRGSKVTKLCWVDFCGIILRRRKHFWLQTFPILERVRKERNGTEADEGKGDNDEPAEGFHFRQNDDENKLEGAHGRVKTILDPIEYPTPLFLDTFLQNLIYCLEIKQTFRQTRIDNLHIEVFGVLVYLLLLNKSNKIRVYF